ncbi:MAG: hypothetical protein AAGG81_00480 [Chlamydiota bacterium]
MSVITFARLISVTSTVCFENEQKTKNHIDVKTRKSKPLPAKAVKVAQERFHGELRNDIIKVNQEKLSSKRVKLIDEDVVIKITKPRLSDEEFILYKEEKRARMKLLREKKKVRSIKRSRERDAKSQFSKHDLYDDLCYDQKRNTPHRYNRLEIDQSSSSIVLLDRDEEELEREVLRQRVRHKGRY